MTNKPLTRDKVLAVLDDAHVTTGDASWQRRISEARAAVEAVYAELDAARKDADRYRLLRHGDKQIRAVIERYRRNGMVAAVEMMHYLLDERDAALRKLDAAVRDRSHEA